MVFAYIVHYLLQCITSSKTSQLLTVGLRILYNWYLKHKITCLFCFFEGLTCSPPLRLDGLLLFGAYCVCVVCVSPQEQVWFGLCYPHRVRDLCQPKSIVQAFTQMELAEVSVGFSSYYRGRMNHLCRREV